MKVSEVIFRWLRNVIHRLCIVWRHEGQFCYRIQEQVRVELKIKNKPQAGTICGITEVRVCTVYVLVCKLHVRLEHVREKTILITSSTSCVRYSAVVSSLGMLLLYGRSSVEAR
jgi:hypothetical protein